MHADRREVGDEAQEAGRAQRGAARCAAPPTSSARPPRTRRTRRRSSTRLSATIHQPEPPSRMPSRYDVISCAASASSVTALTVRSGRSSMRTSRARALLALLLERQRLRRGSCAGTRSRPRRARSRRRRGRRSRRPRCVGAHRPCARSHRGHVPVSGGAAPPDAHPFPSSSRNRSSSSCSRRRITAASSVSAWS